MAGFSKILVANRGEIACRVLRTAAGLGYATVAVYSEADLAAPHVALADEAVPLGAAESAASYLDGAKVIAAAKAAGADALHPGYGFLSENAAFAEACAAAGIAFIGPSADAIRAMGDKAVAKRRMIEAGVPCVPGYQDEDQSDDRLAAAAAEIGFPVMVKAAAGGGGRGMRRVDDAAGLPAALASARGEAQAAFGDGTLLLEKAVDGARHVEIQVFGDAHGNAVHLGERDCSVQRRHQKVVEEAPAPGMDQALRDKMGAAAVTAARSIGYCGAGTVEFLLAPDGAFYFLEMNTRLQVEHPVTEMVTGLDLVAWQIAVAEGAPLPLAQDAIRLDGHAIEVRLYAEDPAQGFMPASGPVLRWQSPAGTGLRVDAGISAGFHVSPHYDPMVAKIIAHGPDREVARRRLATGLRRTVLLGMAHNRDFLLQVLEDPAFAAGGVSTGFLAERGLLDRPAPAPGGADWALAALLLYLCRGTGYRQPGGMADWQSSQAGGGLAAALRLTCGTAKQEVHVRPAGAPGSYAAATGDAVHRFDDVAVDLEDGRIRFTLDGVRRSAAFAEEADGRLHVADLAAVRSFAETLLRPGAAAAAGSDGIVRAPMHGKVTGIDVAVGDTVAAGQRLLGLEAMKMEHGVTAPVAGQVAEIAVAAGAQVAAESILVRLEVTEG
ncbi:acetyl-CoA carboxylase biotin carboxylase subunit [Marinibaculum pumilum]|uniref:Acetyl-CoA carboxylase biotin carboxylase subunit n=1 Tax=Marinibaculum pumilum TaxID=1766165 RepID=A0ABV7L8Z2_9PROT